MENLSINFPPFLYDEEPFPTLVDKHPVDDATGVIVRALEAGLPKRFAAHLAGYHESWVYKRCKDDPDYAKLINQAVAKGVAYRVGRINKHAKNNWQADAWMLARTHPREFAEPAVALKTELSVSTGPTNIVVVGPERAAILASRHEQIRAKTRELLAHRNSDENS